MPKTVLTHKQIAFIEKNYLRMSGGDIDIKFGVSEGVSCRYMKKNGLRMPRELMIKIRTEKLAKRTTSTPKIDRYLKDHYLTVPLKRMAIVIDRSDTFVATRMRQLGLITPRHIVEKFIADARIKKGNTPPNKGKKQRDYMSSEQIEKTKATRFQKGQIPHNAIGFKDGDISVRHHHRRPGVGIKHIRLGRAKWIPLHQHLWEKENGKLPKGHCLWFRDQDPSNVTLDNLELITRKENYWRNSASKNLSDRYVAFTIVGKNQTDLIDEVLKDKKLIEAKRQQIILKRTINERAANSKKARKHEG